MSIYDLQQSCCGNGFSLGNKAETLVILITTDLAFTVSSSNEKQSLQLLPPWKYTRGVEHFDEDMFVFLYLWKNWQCSMSSCSRMQRWSSPTLLHWHSSCNSGRTDHFWWWIGNNSLATKAELLVEVVVGLFFPFTGTLLSCVMSYRMWFWRLMQFLLYSPLNHNFECLLYCINC